MRNHFTSRFLHFTFATLRFTGFFAGHLLYVPEIVIDSCRTSLKSSIRNLHASSAIFL